MAKSPKKIPLSPQPDNTANPTRPVTEPPGGSHGDTGHSVPALTGTEPTPGTSTGSGADVPGRHSSVIISQMPEPEPHVPARRASAEDDPRLPGASQATPAIDSAIGTDLRPATFIDPALAALLTSADSSAEGIRYDKHKKTYVDLEHGTVMVRKHPDGSYQQTHPGELSPTGERVEQIPGSKRWRQVAPNRSPVDADPVLVEANEPTPGPSKRPRLDEQTSAAEEAGILVESLLSRQPDALDLSAGQWRNWGKNTPPESGASIEIEGAHYPIVDQGIHPVTGLVYLQHPGFAPGRYDAFEQMLRLEPSRQPKWALHRDGQWRVLENHFPFEMPLKQYVANSFKYLSDHSQSNLARAVFDQSHPLGTVTGHGLSVMTLTFRHWMDRINNEAPMRGLMDPLLMLPPLPVQPFTMVPGGVLSLPAPSPRFLQRIDFDPQQFPLEWGTYAAAPTGPSLRTLFSTVLRQNGYVINTTPRAMSEGALLFHREGVAAIFVLKLPRVTGSTIARYSVPGAEMSSPAFLAKLSHVSRQTLTTHLAQNQIVYLVGGTQEIAPGKPTLFMVREG